MAAPKGLLAILASGKGKPMPEGEGGGDEEMAPASERGETDVGKRASQDVIDAIEAKDAAGLYDALERVVRACQGGDEEE